MEFDSNILDIQRKLKSLQSECGNLQEADISPEKLPAVLEKWNKTVKRCDAAIQRKIHLYLVLNTKFCFLPEVVSVSDEVAHLVGTAPALGPRLLARLVRGCGLEAFALETVLHADPVLALEYCHLLLQHNQQLSVRATLDEAAILVQHLFSSLCFFESSQVAFKEHICGKLQVDIVQVVDSLPSLLGKKLQNSSEEEKLETGGHLAKTLIDLVSSCMRAMQTPLEDGTHFYSRTMFLGFEFGKWPKAGSAIFVFEKVVRECDKSMKSVDLDLWMKWEEMQGDMEGKSLQMEIGEAAFRCVEMEPLFPEACPKLMDLIAVLMGFRQKPVTEVELADFGKITAALEDDHKASKEWLLALLQSGRSLADEQTASLLSRHSALWDLEVVQAVLSLAATGQQTDKTFGLTSDAFKSLTLHDQKKLIKTFFGINGITDRLKRPDFDTQVTTVLNRTASLQSTRDKWLPQLLLLSLQSPKELVERAIASGMASRGQGSLIAVALSELDFLCHMAHANSNLLVSALNSAIAHIEPSTSNLGHLVQQLEEHKLLTAADFLRACLLPALKHDLASYRISHLLLWIQLLKRLLRIEAPQLADLEGKVSLAVLLAVLAELLQRASWVLGKFRNAESLLRAETVLLVRPLACKYANSISNPEDKELLWLRAGLLRLTSHNRAHFGAIWTHFHLPVPSMNMGSLLLSREAMHQQSGMPPGGPDQLLSPLLILLPSCCTPEWRLLISSLARVLSTYNTADQEEAEERDEAKMLPEAIRLLVIALMLQALMLSQQQPPDDTAYSNECALACLENSVRNLGIIMKEEWLPKLTDASEVENGAGVVRQVALLLRSLPPAIANSCSLALSGVLQQAHEVLLLQAGVQTELATWCAQELALSLALLPDRESRQALARKLLIEPTLI